MELTNVPKRPVSEGRVLQGLRRSGGRLVQNGDRVEPVGLSRLMEGVDREIRVSGEVFDDPRR